MHSRSCSTSNQKRCFKSTVFHLFSNVNHLIERWSNESAEANYVYIVFFGCGQNFISRIHHTQINNLIVIAAQYNRDNILSDVVNVALYRSQQNFCFWFTLFGLILLRFDERNQNGNAFLHYPRAFHYLRQKHLTGAKKIANYIHTVHHRSFNYLNRVIILLPCLFYVVFDIVYYSFYKCVLNSLFNGAFTPFISLLLRFFFTLIFYPIRVLYQLFSSIRVSVQQYIFNQFFSSGSISSYTSSWVGLTIAISSPA